MCSSGRVSIQPAVCVCVCVWECVRASAAVCVSVDILNVWARC